MQRSPSTDNWPTDQKGWNNLAIVLFQDQRHGNNIMPTLSKLLVTDGHNKKNSSLDLSQVQ